MSSPVTGKHLVVLIAFAIAVTMTAVTMVAAPAGLTGQGAVDVTHSPLYITGTSSDTGITIQEATTAQGLDRLEIDLTQDFATNDTLEITLDLQNAGDRAMVVRLTTNTSTHIELTGVNASGATVVATSGINATPRTFQITDLAANRGETVSVTLTYNVTDGSGNEPIGNDEIDIFVTPITDSGG